MRLFVFSPRLSLLMVFATFLPTVLAAQVQLNLLSADGASYPEIHVRFQADNRQGALLRSFQPSDFQVVEDGVSRPVLRVLCPEPETPAMSLAFTIDISYSMSLAGRLDYAKSAASNLVRSLKIPPGSVGITAFGDDSNIHLPFSQDSSQIQSAITSLLPTGNGTDFYGAFIDAGTGALDFTKSGPGTRYIVFITDALQQLSTAAENQVINAAKAAGITIFTITMTKNAYNLSLRRIATQTGGVWFENATSEQIIQQIFQEIRDRIVVYPPCEFVYSTNGCEPRRNATVTLTKNNGTSTKTISFLIPTNAIHALRFSPIVVDFGTVAGGSVVDRQITWSAAVRPVQVSRILAPNPPFTIVDAGANPPFTLDPSSPRTMTLRCAPQVTGHYVGEVLFESDAPCAPPLPLTCGVYDSQPLRIVQPNGGEKLFTNTVYQVKWTSPRPDLPVALEYSTNAGQQWSNITTYVTGNVRNWVVPATPSDSCLAVVSTIESRNSLSDSSPLPLQPADVVHLASSPDGSITALTEGDGRVVLASSKTGAFLALLSGHSGSTTAAGFSHTGALLATGGGDGMVRVWNPRTATLQQTLSGFTGGIQSLAFSSDDAVLAVADVNGVTLWRTADWSRLWTASGTSALGSVLAFDPRDRWVAVTNGAAIAALRRSDGGVAQRLTAHTGTVRSLAFSPDGRVLVSGGEDRVIRIWRIPDWTNTGTLSGHSGSVVSLTVSSLALRIVSSSLDNTIRIWDGRRFALAATIRGVASSYLDAAYSGSWNMLLSASGDRRLRLYHYALPQGDDSDSLWSIITPVSTLSHRMDDFDTLRCIGQEGARDLLIWNSGNQPVTVDSLSLTGSGAPAYRVIGSSPSLPRTLAPGDSLHVSLVFRPAVSGPFEAQLRAHLSGSTTSPYDISLQGRLLRTSMTLVPSTLDAGIVYPCQDSLIAFYTVTNDGETVIDPEGIDLVPAANAEAQLLLGRPLAPGESDSVRVVVRSLTLGSLTRSLHLRYAPCDLTSRADLVGLVLSPTPTVSPAILDFGLVPVGDSLSRTVTVFNPTRHPMRVTEIVGDPSPFHIVPADSVPKILAPGDSLTMTVTFVPSVSRSYLGSIVTRTDTPCFDSVLVVLRGSAEQKPSIQVSDIGFGVLRCPDEHNRQQVMTVYNRGGLPLHLMNVRVLGADSLSFTLLPSPSLPDTLAPGDSVRWTIQFQPSRPGLHIAMVEITSDAANAPVTLAVLNGQRLQYSFSVSPVSMSDTLARCSFPYTIPLHLRNHGTEPITLDLLPPPPFLFQAGTSTFTLASGADSTILLSVLALPDGMYRGTVTIVSRECVLRDSVVLSLLVATMEPTWNPGRLDFPITVVSTTRRDSVVFVNTTPFPITFSDMRLRFGTKAMKGDSLPVMPRVLLPGERLSAVILFHPDGITTNIDTLLTTITTPCDRELAIPLSGITTAPRAMLGLPDLVAAVGDTISLPVQLLASLSLTDAGVTRYRAIVSWNRSLLWPLRVETSAGSVSMTHRAIGDRREVTLEGTGFTASSPSTLASLRAVVLLGNDSTTDLRFEDFTWLDGAPVSTITSPGSLRVTGYCTEGGTWLLTMRELVRQVRVGESTTGDELHLSFEVTRDAQLEVSLYSTLGADMGITRNIQCGPGAHRMILPVSSLAPGMYILAVRTGSESVLFPVLHRRP